MGLKEVKHVFAQQAANFVNLLPWEAFETVNDSTFKKRLVKFKGNSSINRFWRKQAEILPWTSFMQQLWLLGDVTGKHHRLCLGLQAFPQTASPLVPLESDCGHRPYSDPAGHFSCYVMRTEQELLQSVFLPLNLNHKPETYRKRLMSISQLSFLCYPQKSMHLCLILNTIRNCVDFSLEV